MGLAGRIRHSPVFILIAFFVFVPMIASGKESTGPFDHKRWEKISKRVDYTETPPEMKERPDKSIPELTDKQKLAIQIILISIVAASLIFLTIRIWLHYSSITGKVKISDLKVSTPDDAFTDRIQLQKRYGEAILNSDYRMALRYFYLILLQELAGQGVIVLQRDKTNHQYLREICDNSLAPVFADLTWTVESVWFGTQTIDEHLFAEATEKAKAMIKSSPLSKEKR